MDRITGKKIIKSESMFSLLLKLFIKNSRMKAIGVESIDKLAINFDFFTPKMIGNVFA